ncbi:MAG: response regulator transcription factor, partial [Anaerolineae bacterium]|nr:response regulator transcription factor [Anaerolineae bacterium]
ITLQEPDWEVGEAHDGESGLLLVEAERPDLVLLDVMMPDMSGFDVLQRIRLFSDVPVIILTVRDDEIDKVHGLELGADDYIVKPFGHLELLARIRSVLRRVEGTTGQPEKPLILGDLRIDFARRLVTRKREKIGLTGTEYRLLEILARNVGRVVPSETLLGRVWGRYALETPDYLKVYIHRLRLKLEDDPSHPRYLRTIRGEGYALVSPRD